MLKLERVSTKRLLDIISLFGFGVILFITLRQLMGIIDAVVIETDSGAEIWLASERAAITINWEQNALEQSKFEYVRGKQSLSDFSPIRGLQFEHVNAKNDWYGHLNCPLWVLFVILIATRSVSIYLIRYYYDYFKIKQESVSKV